MPLTVHAPAANTAAVATLAAKGDRRHVVRAVHWSLSADPAAPIALTIASAGVPTYTAYVSKGGPGVLDFGPNGYEGADGVGVVVTLPAAGGTTTGAVNVFSGEED